MVSGHEIEILANQYHSSRSSRSASRWPQFSCLAMAQRTGRCSLRDIVECWMLVGDVLPGVLEGV